MTSSVIWPKGVASFMRQSISSPGDSFRRWSSFAPILRMHILGRSPLEPYFIGVCAKGMRESGRGPYPAQKALPTRGTW